jgi:hypothetical protein
VTALRPFGQNGATAMGLAENRSPAADGSYSGSLPMT